MNSFQDTNKEIIAFSREWNTTTKNITYLLNKYAASLARIEERQHLDRLIIKTTPTEEKNVLQTPQKGFIKPAQND